MWANSFSVRYEAERKHLAFLEQRCDSRSEFLWLHKGHWDFPGSETSMCGQCLTPGWSVIVILRGAWLRDNATYQMNQGNVCLSFSLSPSLPPFLYLSLCWTSTHRSPEFSIPFILSLLTQDSHCVSISNVFRFIPPMIGINQPLLYSTLCLVNIY